MSKPNQDGKLRRGCIVEVNPENILAVGRGIGIVDREGETIARVIFPASDPNRSVACLVKDCTVVSASFSEVPK